MRSSRVYFILIILIVFLVQGIIFAEDSNVSHKISAMIKEKMEVNKIYRVNKDEEFLKKVLAGSEFRGGLYSTFIFKKDNTFILKFNHYNANYKFTEKGTWDIKDGNLVVRFNGKHKSWSGSYKIDRYRLAFDDDEMYKYHYTFRIYIKEKTPWTDQSLAIEFN